MVRSSAARHAALCTLASAAACGRLAFDPVSDAATDVVTDVPPVDVCSSTPACTSGAWMPAPLQPFDSITSRGASEETEWSAQISCDGLRVVYSTARGSRPDSVYVARRSRVSDPFGAPELQQFPPLSDAFDPSLRDDQLELYFISNTDTKGCMYAVRRAHPGDGWGAPRRILDCDASKFHGPYLSHDGLRLYYDRDDGSVTVMMTSRATLDSDFDSPGAPVIWAGGRPAGYCALSADELTIYCEDGNPSQLVQSVRASRDAAFPSATPVPGLPTRDSRGNPFAFSDPSASGDGRLLVYASTPDGGDVMDNQHLHLAERSCQ